MMYVFILFFKMGSKFSYYFFFLILTISWTTFIRIQRREWNQIVVKQWNQIMNQFRLLVQTLTISWTTNLKPMKSDDPWVNGPGLGLGFRFSSQVVPQDPRLFTATVWENIALGLGPVNQAVAMEGRFEPFMAEFWRGLHHFNHGHLVGDWNMTGWFSHSVGNI